MPLQLRYGFGCGAGDAGGNGGVETVVAVGTVGDAGGNGGAEAVVAVGTVGAGAVGAAVAGAVGETVPLIAAFWFLPIV